MDWYLIYYSLLSDADKIIQLDWMPARAQASTSDLLERHDFGRAFFHAEMSEAILQESIWTLFFGSHLECNKCHKASPLRRPYQVPCWYHSLLQHWPLIGNDFAAWQRHHDMTRSNQPCNTGSPPSICQRPRFLWRRDLWRGKFGHVDAKQCTGIQKIPKKKLRN